MLHFGPRRCGAAHFLGAQSGDDQEVMGLQQPRAHLGEDGSRTSQQPARRQTRTAEIPSGSILYYTLYV